MSNQSPHTGAPASGIQRTYSPLLFTISILAFLSLMPSNILAKKVICVDGCNTRYVNNHEGYERANMAQGDVIQVGGNLTTCLANLANGDELIIISHGVGDGEAFRWGGANYQGFGTGPNPMPVPNGFNQLMNINVKFCTCWSTNDHDGAAGPDSTLLSKLLGALGGTARGHTGSGFKDFAASKACVVVTGGTAAQRIAARARLNTTKTWRDNPPINRPGPPNPNQQSEAQDLIDAFFPNAGLTVTIPGYKEPFNTAVVPAPNDGGASGCACLTGEGCGFGPVEFAGPIPTMSQWGVIFLALIILCLGGIALQSARLKTSKI